MFIKLLIVGSCMVLFGNRIARAWVQAAHRHKFLDISIPKSGGWPHITDPGGQQAVTIAIIFIGGWCIFVALIGGFATQWLSG